MSAGSGTQFAIPETSRIFNKRESCPKQAKSGSQHLTRLESHVPRRQVTARSTFRVGSARALSRRFSPNEVVTVLVLCLGIAWMALPSPIAIAQQGAANSVQAQRSEEKIQDKAEGVTTPGGPGNFIDPSAEKSEQVSSDAETPVIAFSASVTNSGENTRIFVDLDRSVDIEAFFMLEPDRLVIDMPSVYFRFDEANAMKPAGVATEIRYGAIAKGRSRIVVTLAAPVSLKRAEVVEIEKDRKYRLAVELVTSKREAFVAEAAVQQQRIGASGKVATKGARVRTEKGASGRFVVVIDPGHGGIDGGAKGKGGLREKDLTLTLAQKLRETIGKDSRFEVKLTREDDVFIALSERVAFARRNHADLMISLHADSLRQKSVRGATVYTLSRDASDELAHELAQSENMSDILAGLEVSTADDAVNDILADLTARETARFSKRFSDSIVTRLEKQIAMIRNPQRSAAFAVLKAPEIPSVLLELGYLSNPEDEKLLGDPTWQQRIASEIARSVLHFFEPRL